MKKRSIISENNFSTVVAEYVPIPKTETGYQSERELEEDFLSRLKRQGYERIKDPTEEVLIENLRKKLEELNKVALGNAGFSDKEWDYFFKNVLANSADGVREKTWRFQVENRYTITRDDGSEINVMLIDKKNIYNNKLEVFNQYSEEGTKYKGRYDVTVLVNGLPIVHIELKRRGVSIKEAFNQIARYSRDNFFGGYGLFDWVQVFVISNGTETKYYSNTTREQAQKENKNNKTPKRKTSHSFEFTSYWADGKNHNITDLVDFAETFFNKGALLNILTKYCVFTVDKLLLVMRPYQIIATEKIVEKIKTAEQYKKIGTIDAGGYVWHTTGSGKTLTSFKAAQIATELDFIDKVIFVVDRKDLDYQTIKEFEKFGGKESVSGNANTSVLKRNLEDENQKIIVTTIQKLNIFAKKNKNVRDLVFSKNYVMIFDECHRSQFGEMHKEIITAFKNYFLFGFTGTPIFSENAKGGNNLIKTKQGVQNVKLTEQIFGKCLHAYTIVDAISDGNVLPFRVELVDTIKIKDGANDVKVRAIDRDSALKAPQRIEAVSKYIIDHFDVKTYRDSSSYAQNSSTNTVELAKSNANSSIMETKSERKNIKGFNSIFAVDSIKSAELYYTELKKQINERSSALQIATIFCYAPNEDAEAFLEEEFETDHLSKPSRDFLNDVIDDYNKMFSTSWDTSGDNFGGFYKDVSMRVKNKEIDLLIVVNMFLTGFDATTLNTLWVDKNLKYHGLIQAFSRTNRILNSQKIYGNIITFRKLEKQINDACSLFGNKESNSVILVRSFVDYYNGYESKPGYVQIVADLKEKFPLDQSILGEANEKEFVKLFGAFLRVENILKPFDEFRGKEILTQRERQDYQSKYLNLNDKYRKEKSGEAINIADDLVFEIELIKQITVNIDYILLMVKKYIEAKNSEEQEVALADMTSTIDSRPELRSKRELILGFINEVNNKTDVSSEWARFVNEQKEKELKDLIKHENLNDKKTRAFIDYCHDNGEIKETGTDLDEILPPMSRFEDSEIRSQKKKTVLEKLKVFLDKFLF